MVINTSYILQMKLREVQQLAQEHTAHVAAALGSPSQLCRLTPSGCKVLPKLRSAQLTQVCGSPKNAGLSKPRGPFPLYPLGTVLAPHCQIYPLWSPSLEITFCSIQTVGSPFFHRWAVLVYQEAQEKESPHHSRTHLAWTGEGRLEAAMVNPGMLRVLKQKPELSSCW